MHTEASSGIILFIAAILALVLDNSPLSHYYNDLLNVNLTLNLHVIDLTKPILLWINDGLMAIFFLLVGLEIKREVLEGELNSAAKAVLPGIAAVGGVVAPAIIYVIINHTGNMALRGWAIPTATDIAFALGVLALLGSRVSVSLKVFLTALAIIDDLAAIVIIAIFYTSQLSWLSLAFAGVCLIILILFNRIGITSFIPYAIVGFILWVCVLKSGVHATLAGVIIALVYPLRSKKDPSISPSRRVENSLHPWVAFLVLPLFAFANSGIPFANLSIQSLVDPIPLGIALGLFLGKQIGVFVTSWISIKLGMAKLPADASWAQLYGVALICGVGFTMSLFIGSLAFAEGGMAYGELVRLGVLVGSILSGVCGYLFLRLTCAKKAS